MSVTHTRARTHARTHTQCFRFGNFRGAAGENTRNFSELTIFSDFLRSFCASKKKTWLLLAQVSRTSARSPAQTASPPQLSRTQVVFLERARGRFLRPCLVAAIIFPTQNGCQKSPIILTLPLSEAQWPNGYSVELRIKLSSVRIRPWPLR